MLGNFRPFKRELSKTDREQYKTLYCSVCKCIQKKYGLIATSCNSYDLVFIILSLYSLNNIVIEKDSKERCPVSVFKKVNICNIRNCDEIADFSVFILYLLYKDKIIDNEKNFKTDIIYSLFKKNFTKLENTSLFKKYCNQADNIFKLEKSVKTIEGKIKIFSDFIFEISKDVFKKETKILPVSFYYNMISIMYYLDALKDYKNDIKNNKENFLKEIAEQKIDIFKFSEYEIMKNIKKIKECLNNNRNELVTNILDISIVRKLLILQGAFK